MLVKTFLSVFGDHPRAGGEKHRILAILDCFRGSPPRRRGKDKRNRGLLPSTGITPAWAGKRYDQLGRRAQRQDHPRMGGEKPSVREMLSDLMGSPPRGRGKARIAHQESQCQRITPAWAGKSDGEPDADAESQDHPRMGGEKGRPAQGGTPATGSPPHGRGKEERRKSGEIRARITPAWAGKSQRGVEDLKKAGDHPRVGGEKFSVSALVLSAQGSPPRRRGKVDNEKMGQRYPGITPA